MSRMSCVGFEAKASIEPFAVGTIAMFEVIDPSLAFSVETTGCASRWATRTDSLAGLLVRPWR